MIRGLHDWVNQIKLEYPHTLERMAIRNALYKRQITKREKFLNLKKLGKSKLHIFFVSYSRVRKKSWVLVKWINEKFPRINPS